ncbi:MAG: sugar transferase [Roseburia sp.]|nr:sugar transferase [Roseburia sp.]MCM1277881.1 sugar transferase [Robinsoniella sp.]
MKDFEWEHKAGFYEKYIKRMLDVVLSLAALMFLSPVMLLVALSVRIKLGSPVLFKQERPGKIDGRTGREKLFVMYKFRSMTDERDVKGELLPDGVRLTAFGKALRSASLDELPELFLILKGDMSIVGPRPLAIKYLPYYTKEERRRHLVRPGLTGLAQVNGRNGIGWEQRFQYDIQYVEHITFLGDLRIILQTVYKVLGRKDIIVRGEGTVLDFDVERRKGIL